MRLSVALLGFIAFGEVGYFWGSWSEMSPEVAARMFPMLIRNTVLLSSLWGVTAIIGRWASEEGK